MQSNNNLMQKKGKIKKEMKSKHIITILKKKKRQIQKRNLTMLSGLCKTGLRTGIESIKTDYKVQKYIDPYMVNCIFCKDAKVIQQEKKMCF